MRVFRSLILYLFSSAFLLSQSDPAAQQDQEAAREKLLKAADQLDTMSSQVDALRSQLDQQKAAIETLKNQLAQANTDNAALKDDIATLKTALEKLDAARSQERDVLLKKVGDIVAEALKSHAPAPVEAPTKLDNPPPVAQAPPAQDGKGYYYVVKKGDTLHDIAAAYEAQGVKVTVDDLRKANNIPKSAYIHVGQKIFIPKKE